MGDSLTKQQFWVTSALWSFAQRIYLVHGPLPGCNGPWTLRWHETFLGLGILAATCDRLPRLAGRTSTFLWTCTWHCYWDERQPKYILPNITSKLQEIGTHEKIPQVVSLSPKTTGGLGVAYTLVQWSEGGPGCNSNPSLQGCFWDGSPLPEWYKSALPKAVKVPEQYPLFVMGPIRASSPNVVSDSGPLGSKVLWDSTYWVNPDHTSRNFSTSYKSVCMQTGADEIETPCSLRCSRPSSIRSHTAWSRYPIKLNFWYLSLCHGDMVGAIKSLGPAHKIHKSI